MATVQRSPQGGLAEVLDLILDKGLVIDVFAKISLVGIEIVTIDARIVVASVDTYLRFADAVGRLDVPGTHPTPVELARTGKYRATKAATSGALDAVGEKIADWLSPN